MHVDIDSLVKANVKIYSVPTIYTSLTNSINDPRSSITAISNIISEDPGLTARMLKLANSPLFAYPSKIETISQAVLVIGTSQIRDLALATSVISLFKGIPRGLVSMETFWQHSVACGITARIIAGYQRKPNIERFFTAGIMHDIGRLIIISEIPEQYKEIMRNCKEGGKCLFSGERDNMGFDHADVGGSLLTEWKLPSNLVELVACHHNPEMAAQHSREAAVLNIADIITHALQMGNSGESLVPPLAESTWDQLKLPLGMLPYIVEQSIQQFDIVVRLILPNME